jgi:hypothetical protein
LKGNGDVFGLTAALVKQEFKSSGGFVPVETAVLEKEAIMPSKEQTTISKKARSNQEAPKPAIANSNIIAQHQIHPATLIQQARINPRSLTTRDVTQLQRMIGNQAVGSLLAQPPPSHTQVVQRKLGGELAATKTGSQLEAGLRKFGLVGIKFSEYTGYLQRLIKADTDINSFAEAVVYLFGDDTDPRKKAAVELAKEAIKKQQEKAAENAEQVRKKASMAAQYPSNVLGTYYRGDGRPQAMVRSDGLTPYGEMSVAEARAKIQYWFGNTGASPIDLHQSWVSKNTDPTPPAGGRPGGILACGNDIGCGGYGASVDGAVRNVYKIDLAQANLQVVQPTLAVLGVPPHPTQGPALILNASTLAAATIIGVRGTGNSGHETSFFCKIPAANVTLIYEQTGPDGMPGQGRGWITPL